MNPLESSGEKKLSLSEEEKRVEKERQDKLLEEFERRKAAVYSGTDKLKKMETYLRVSAEVKKLRDSYGDEVLDRCRLYHLLSGSGLDDEFEITDENPEIFDVGGGIDTEGEIEAFFKKEFPE